MDLHLHSNDLANNDDTNDPDDPDERLDMTYRTFILLLACGLLIAGCSESSDPGSNEPAVDDSLIDSLNAHASGKSDGGTDSFKVEEQAGGPILTVFGDSALLIRDLMSSADPEFLTITAEEFEHNDSTYRMLTLDEGDLSCLTEVGASTMCAVASLDSATISEDLSEATIRGGLESGALGLQLLIEDAGADADTRGISCSPSHEMVTCTLSSLADSESVFPEVSIRESSESGIELELVGLLANMITRKISMPDHIECDLGGPTGLYCHMTVDQYWLPEDGYRGFTVHAISEDSAVGELFRAVEADPDALVTEVSDGVIVEAEDFYCETGLGGYFCSFVDGARNIGMDLRLIAQNDAYTFLRATNLRGQDLFDVLLASPLTGFSHGAALLSASAEDSDATESVTCYRSMGESSEEYCEIRVQAAEIPENPTLTGVAATFEGPLAEKLYEALLEVEGATVEGMDSVVYEALRCKTSEESASCELLIF